MEKSPSPADPPTDPTPLAVREAATTHLVSQLIHDQRNHFNALVLEVADLGEQAAERGVALDTTRLRELVAEAVEQLQLVRERLDVAAPRRVPVRVAAWLAELRTQVLEEPAYEGLVDWPEAGPDALDEALAARWDAGQLGAALGELLDNAADAIEQAANGSGPRAHRVAVSISLEGKVLVLGIRNRCPSDQTPPPLAHVGRVRGLAGRRHKLGLGCAYARQVAERHGGACTFAYDETASQFHAELRLPLA